MKAESKNEKRVRRQAAGDRYKRGIAIDDVKAKLWRDTQESWARPKPTLPTLKFLTRPWPESYLAPIEKRRGMLST